MRSAGRCCFRPEVPLLVAFVDLTRFAVQSPRVRGSERANTLDAYYERVAVTVEAAEGRVVKNIGDDALVVIFTRRGDAGRGSGPK